MHAVAFTGHRPESLSYNIESSFDMLIKLTPQIQKEIRKSILAGCITFYCGAAQGADIVCGEIVIAEKAAGHPEIQLICVIPFKEQANNWKEPWKTRYNHLLNNTDRVICINDTYQKGCYQIRNRYLVDHCSTLIAIYNGKSTGGTAYTVNYARKHGKNIIVIHTDQSD